MGMELLTVKIYIKLMKGMCDVNKVEKVKIPVFVECKINSEYPLRKRWKLSSKDTVFNNERKNYNGFKNKIVIPLSLEMKVKGSENWNEVAKKESDE